MREIKEEVKIKIPIIYIYNAKLFMLSSNYILKFWYCKMN